MDRSCLEVSWKLEDHFSLTLGIIIIMNDKTAVQPEPRRWLVKLGISRGKRDSQ